MDWGKILVDSITVAIIGAAAVLISTVLANVITDVKGYKKISRKIGDVSNTSLAGQHREIEKAIDQGNCLVKDSIKGSTELILSSTKDVLMRVQGINDHLIKEKADQENSFKNLDKDQQKIMEHVEGIHALAREWEKTINRNIELENKVKLLEEKVRVLTWELNQLSSGKGYFKDGSENDLEL